MRLNAAILVFLTFCVSTNGWGQAQQHRILILLNSSSSMRDAWTDNESKYNVADRLVTTLVDSLYLINDEVEFGLRVFGHQNRVEESNCYDTKSEVMFSKDTRTQIFLRLKALKQSGLPSLGFALKETNHDISATGGHKYSLLVVTDDSVSCEQALCDVVFKNSAYRGLWSVYVLNIGGNKVFESKYNCLGRFLNIRTESDISHSIEEIVSAYRKAIPHKKHLEQISDRSVEGAPAIKPVVKDTLPSVHARQVASDTSATVRSQSVVVIKQGSRIKTDTEDKFGHLNLISEGGINTARIQLDKGNNTGTGESQVVPLGKTRLKAGKYRMSYFVDGREVSMTFKVLANMITDVRLR